ncbi:glycosyltransferase family 39 protein [Candidatus Woesearchaeota archaeon]|nr:glycosyltransferase family 39 protein [Candidatus Woesearchaeota archaeon]
MGKYFYSLGRNAFIEPFRPPLLSLINGFLWKLSFDPLIMGRILSIVISSLFLFYLYFFGAKVFNKAISLIAVIVLIITPVFFINSFRIFTTLPALLLVFISFYFFNKERYFFAGVFCGLAFLTRFPFALSILVLTIVLFIEIIKDKTKFNDNLLNLLKIWIPFISSVVVLCLYSYFMFESEDLVFFQRIFMPLLGGIYTSNITSFFHTGGFLYYFKNIFLQNPLFWFSLPGLYFFFRRKYYKNKEKLVFLFAFLIFALYFSISSHKEIRYGLAFFSFMALFVGLGVDGIFNILKRQKWLNKYVLSASLILIFIIILIIPFSSTHNLVKLLNTSGKDEDFYSFLKENNLNGSVITTTPFPSVFIDNKMYIAYYYSMPRLKDILEEKDYNYIIFSSIECNPVDEKCPEQREKILEIIRSNKLIYKTETYKLYKRN